jgi:hypothetical protein
MANQDNKKRPMMATHPRARATRKGPRKSTKVDTLARRAEIRALMTSGEWQTGATGKRLADLWGISAHAVRCLAAEISRELGWKPDEEARRRVLDVLDEAEDTAREVLAATPADRDECAPLELKLKGAKALADIARARADALGMRAHAAPAEAPPPNKNEPPPGFTTEAPKERTWS